MRAYSAHDTKFIRHFMWTKNGYEIKSNYKINSVIQCTTCYIKNKSLKFHVLICMYVIFYLFSNALVIILNFMIINVCVYLLPICNMQVTC
jgi:hypothetical protein